MKKIILSLLFFAVVFPIAMQAQNLTQSGFTAVVLPKYMNSGTATRLPVIFRATVTGLTANTQYRYFAQAAKFSDLNTTNSGAGNPLFTNPDSANFGYTTSANVAVAGGYSLFRTDASGNYTGWFGFVNTGNARFANGSYIIPSIVIGDSAAGAIVSKLALNDSIKVLGFATTAADTACTGVWGRSNAFAKNPILLFDNVAGTGRPLAVTYTESEGLTVASVVPFYTDSVNAKAGRWGTIVPNVLTTGIQRIEQRSLTTGNIIGFNTSANGTWGNVSTINPVGGSATPLIVDSTAAPLPVELTSFSAVITSGKVVLNWATATEVNNARFEILRKSANEDYKVVGTVSGNGTTTNRNEYSFTDGTAKSGSFTYRLRQVDFDGTATLSNEINADLGITVSNFTLSQNYPNPFNPSTVINFSVATTGNTSLKVYSASGELVATLFDNLADANKVYSVNFAAKNLTSGVYFYRLVSGSFTETKSMMLLK